MKVLYKSYVIYFSFLNTKSKKKSVLIAETSVYAVVVVDITELNWLYIHPFCMYNYEDDKHFPHEHTVVYMQSLTWFFRPVSRIKQGYWSNISMLLTGFYYILLHILF